MEKLTNKQLLEEIQKIRHIDDGRTCLTVDGGLCPCQEEGVWKLVFATREETLREVIEILEKRVEIIPLRHSEWCDVRLVGGIRCNCDLSPAWFAQQDITETISLLKSSLLRNVRKEE